MPTRTLELTYYSSCHSSHNNYFEKLCSLPNPVILESGQHDRGRWDILTADPVKVIRLSLDTGHLTKETVQTQLSKIADHIEKYTSIDTDSRLPFVSGAIGLINYSTGEIIAGIKPPNNKGANQPNSWPLIYTGIYQWAILQDHKTKRSWLVADAKLAQDDWNQLCDRLNNKTAKPKHFVYPSAFTLNTGWQCSLEYEQYKTRFEQIQDYIHAGDCYQVNLTRRFSSNYSGKPSTIYSQLSQHAPAPFSAYLEHAGNCVISRSPESFITVKNGEVTTRPIKGSRPVGETPQRNIQHIESLSRSEKDRSENLMIVDLMRNDLGKLCKTGSIAVTRLFDIESYSNVHHMVSTIKGKIKKRSARASLELLGSCMPGGSVTGAPKIRAMEIIAESEPHSRSIYCGSLFYVNSNGDMNSNILIRSLLFEKNRPEDTEGTVYCWGGGAIVADSDVDSEYEESYYKVAHLLELLAKYQVNNH